MDVTKIIQEYSGIQDTNEPLREYNEFIEKNPKLKLLDPIDFPKELMISTITLISHLPVIFNVLAIAKYLDLSKGFIESIKCGKENGICRSLVPIKIKKTKKTKKNKKIKKLNKINFYNQVSIVVNCNQQRDFMCVNIKLFKNGSIQVTGCKKISALIWILNKLFRMLKENIPINEETLKTQDNLMKYSEPHAFLNVSELQNFKIVMINSNFELGFDINREALFNVLVKNKVDCWFDTARHAGVNIKLKTQHQENKTTEPHITTIIVFAKGKIIITGAQSYLQVMECYKFINIFLIENFNLIIMNSQT